MRRRVQKWGNSLAVRIPTDVARACALSAGMPIEVRHEAGKIILVPDRARRGRYRLADLVSKIHRRNRPERIAFGRPIGGEVW